MPRRIKHRRTKHAIRRWYGEIYRIPPREGGALAHCLFCDWSRFFPDRARKNWNSVDRADAAVRGHVRKAHPDKILKTWKPDASAVGTVVAGALGAVIAGAALFGSLRDYRESQTVLDHIPNSPLDCFLLPEPKDLKERKK